MKIEKLDNNGRGILFFDNKITFVENALPGEDVEIKVVNSKKKYNEAVVTKYNELSSDRINVLCPNYDNCGGCNIMHMNYEKQLELKKQKVMDLLKKFGDIDYKIENIIHDDNFNYRNKATFQVKEKIGYFKEKSYDLIEINNCLLVDKKINNILKEVKKLDLDNIYQIVIRASKNIDESMVVFKLKEDREIDIKDLNVTSIIKYVDKKYITIKGKDYITEKLGDLTFIISPDSFFQVNTNGAYKLYSEVLKNSNLKKDDKVLDLFCGTGTIGIFLSEYCDYVTGLEINEYAVKDALKNKQINNIKNIEFICDDAKNVDIKDVDLVVVDPPRAGLDSMMINYLLNIDIKRIIYVSCDPVTLARDLKGLTKIYNIKEIELVDMFPNTYHVESVVLLERK